MLLFFFLNQFLKLVIYFLSVSPEAIFSFDTSQAQWASGQPHAFGQFRFISATYKQKLHAQQVHTSLASDGCAAVMFDNRHGLSARKK